MHENIFIYLKVFYTEQYVWLDGIIIVIEIKNFFYILKVYVMFLSQ